eukprot:scaffold429_cov169-Amphora_coffeaeformis.AAC.5
MMRGVDTPASSMNKSKRSASCLALLEFNDNDRREAIDETQSNGMVTLAATLFFCLEACAPDR